MSRPEVQAVLAAASVIPVLVVDDAAAAGPLAKALSAGGLRVAELTLRTASAIQAMQAMKAAAPELFVGMGTVLSAEQARASVEAGADFLVSPGLTPTLGEAMRATGAACLPGVATAGEAMAAREQGFFAQKFFPAEPAGGIAYLKALHGPLPDVVFCPTGGISADAAPDYLALANVACVGGSWIATNAMISAGDWAGIEANARRAARM